MFDYASGEVYFNRYRSPYRFIKIEDAKYNIDGQFIYCRFGGKEGQEQVDNNDLGFFDPEGGPFLSCDDFKIDGKVVTRIALNDEGNGILFFTEQS